VYKKNSIAKKTINSKSIQNITQSEVIDWLMFNVKLAVFQLYSWRELKLTNN